MTKKKSQSLSPGWFLLLAIVLGVTSVGCGLSDTLAGLTSPTREIQPTRIPLPTFTPTLVNMINIDVGADTGAGAGEIDPSPAEPTATPTPEPSPTPPPPPTETPAPANNTVTVTVNQDMNVRGGPGTNYPVIGTAPAGASSTAVGRNNDASWVQVQYPPGSGDTGWVYASLVQIDGDVQAVTVVQAPAPPPVAANPPTQEEAPPPVPTAPKYQFTPTAWHANGNEAIVHFRGTIRDEGGNAVNGFSVLVDNGSWSVLAHPSGASHHYPDKPDGEWDVVIPDIRTGIGWWTLTVVSYDCPGFEVEFNAQCKQFTRLSEDIRVEVIYPDETIIWADWTCHWDCNKGLYVNAYRRP
ncbi:MAG: SH3 domain-containing protein [Anaerolineae bacterium]|nr:SH3 domain-containing protein [Anaerolineae bacterium]